jgi:hypothetical protein
LELNPKDFDANFEVAMLFEQNDPKQALIYYEAGIKIMKEELAKEHTSHFLTPWFSSCEDPNAHLEVARKMVPPELLNNTAVLLMEADRFDEALLHLEEARENCNRMMQEVTKSEEGEPDKRLVALSLNIKFNLAYCKEHHNKIGEANDLYKSILKEEPNYTDAYLRLAYLAKKRGDIKRSLDFVEASKSNFKKGFNQPTNLYCIKGSFLKNYG